MQSRLMIAVVAVIWGFTFMATKFGLQYTTPYLYNTLRFSIAVVILLPFVKKISKREAKYTVILSLLYAASVLFQTLSVNYGQTINASALMGFNIVITGLLGYLVFKEKPGYVSIIMAVVGVGLLSDFRISFSTLGDLYALLSACCYGLQIFYVSYFSKKLEHVHILSVVFYQSLVAAVFNSLWLPFFPEKFAFSPMLVGSLLYNSVFTLILATVIQFKYQKFVKVIEVTLILILSDVIVVILGLSLGESLTVMQFVGVALLTATSITNALFQRFVRK